ncbi:hypothetical protein [Streptomyces sp. NPDC056264]|uniref:hypothetical protein n=1 Tax=Streptomyces sp. NPDC056264 TaxID=3345767 RepID=UPI003AAE695B
MGSDVLGPSSWPEVEPWTPAHQAVEMSEYETLSMLLDSGADPDEVCFGHTLLTHAIGLEGNGLSAIDGETPLQIAKHYHHEPIRRLLQRFLGLNKEDGAELTVGPVRVYGAPNDYSTGRHAHPSDFLQWPTVLECEAPSGAPAEAVQAVTSVLEALWHGGFKAVAACGFEDELPARGGTDRYPRPAGVSGASAASPGSWWRNLISRGKGKGGVL